VSHGPRKPSPSPAWQWASMTSGRLMALARAESGRRPRSRLEPLRETAHRALIEAHLAESNWSEAHRQFRRCQQLFREELGVEPTASLRSLLEARQPRVPLTVGPR
jgi:Bacterial transcriptional activator domain